MLKGLHQWHVVLIQHAYSVKTMQRDGLQYVYIDASRQVYSIYRQIQSAARLRF